MKIYLNRVPIRAPWGGGAKFVNSFYDFFESESENEHELCDPTDSLAIPDVILLAGLPSEGVCLSVDQAIYYRQFHKPDTKIVLRVNENDARKGTVDVDDLYLRVSEHIDATVFVSDYIKDYFLEKGWRCKHNTVIHNGVDAEVFKPNEKSNNGKVNIVAHHWSNNYMKGFDVYEKLDDWLHTNGDKFSFTYIGRERGTFRNTNVIKPLSGKALGEELGKYDVYVSASRFDPGPNHCLEAMSCELPTYVHKDGGGCIEFAGADHVFSDFDALKELLLSRNFQRNTEFKLSDWDSCVKKYVTFLKEVHER